MSRLHLSCGSRRYAANGGRLPKGAAFGRAEIVCKREKTSISIFSLFQGVQNFTFYILHSLQRSFDARGLKTGLSKIAAQRDFWERGAAGAAGKAASKARRLPWRLDATSLLRMTREDGARSTYSLVTLRGAASGKVSRAVERVS